jgi:hypothetical protein
MNEQGNAMWKLAILIALLPTIALAETAEVKPDELELGETYRCPANAPDKDVYVWVGRFDQAPDGRTIASVALASVASPGDMPVGHAPIDSRQLAGCLREDPSQPIGDPAVFEEGYLTWKTAFLAGEAGVWTAPPNEIYWTIVEAAKP